MAILQLIERSDIEMPLRQAAGVHLKNVVKKGWVEADEVS